MRASAARGLVLRVDGEIDGSNANLVGQAILRFSRLKTPLILDLSHLDFLGIAGLRTLVVRPANMSELI